MVLVTRESSFFVYFIVITGLFTSKPLRHNNQLQLAWRPPSDPLELWRKSIIKRVSILITKRKKKAKGNKKKKKLGSAAGVFYWRSHFYELVTSAVTNCFLFNFFFLFCFLGVRCFETIVFLILWQDKWWCLYPLLSATGKMLWKIACCWFLLIIERDTPPNLLGQRRLARPVAILLGMTNHTQANHDGLKSGIM